MTRFERPLKSRGTGVVSHTGLVLLRELADRTGLTAALSAALPSPLGGHDRGRVFADLACAIADGMISDFRVMGDQRELSGPGERAGPARVPARVPGHLVRRLGAERPRAGRDRQGP
jgi:hypothetical protein